MVIVKVIPDSFQEYEGEWSLVLFSYNCNYRCPGCYNLNYVTDCSNIIGEAKHIIDENISPSHTAVVFLGGEATVWGYDLLEATQYCKNKGLKTKLFTNASIPSVIQVLEDYNCIDSYSIDIKGIKNVSNVIGIDVTDSDYLATLDRTINIIKANNKPIELRTTEWKSVEELDLLKEYVKTKYPGIKHIIQKPFSVNKFKTS